MSKGLLGDYQTAHHARKMGNHSIFTRFSVLGIELPILILKITDKTKDCSVSGININVSVNISKTQLIVNACASRLGSRAGPRTGKRVSAKKGEDRGEGVRGG